MAIHKFSFSKILPLAVVACIGSAYGQVITINGVNLTTGFSTDSQIISDLLKRGKLITD